MLMESRLVEELVGGSFGLSRGSVLNPFAPQTATHSADGTAPKAASIPYKPIDRTHDLREGGEGGVP